MDALINIFRLNNIIKINFRVMMPILFLCAIGLIALKAGVNRDNKEITKECVALVREKVGPVAAFKLAIVVKRLPKTRSGKVLRGTVRKIADGETYKVPPTIDDPAILDEIKKDLKDNNILKS